MAEFIGGPIDSGVVKQLEQRATIYGRKTKTIQDIEYMNSRSAWIRMTSSVNVKGSDSLAKNYILGGLVRYNGTTFSQKSGINFTGSTPSTVYNLSPTTGVRPGPGITGFSVLCKGRFGTIKEANVTFTVWSVEELNDIEKLYFHPGYSVIVEWGHTVYVDNDGKVNYMPTGLTGFKDLFESANFQTVTERLNARKRNLQGNYDAFVGYIKNFSWSLRSDGGYDCTVSTVSFGEILDSLTMNMPGRYDTPNTNEKPASTKRSTLDTFLAILDLFTINNKENKPVTLGFIKEKNETFGNKLQQELLYKDTDVVATGMSLSKEFIFSSNPKLFYIPLKVLLAVVSTGYGFYASVDECNRSSLPLVKFDSQNNDTYTTFASHFSLDPRVCIIVKENSSEITKPKSFDTYSNLKAYRDEKCTSICVSSLFLKDLIKTNAENFLVKDLIDQILNKINTSLGGITELGLHSDGDSGIFKIVDFKNSFKKSEINTLNTQPVIQISGTSNIFSNVNVQSKVSKNLGASIAIAAQASSPPFNQSVGLWTKYNEGLSDRFKLQTQFGNIQEKCIPSNDFTELREEIKQDYLVGVFRENKKRLESAFRDISLEEAEITVRQEEYTEFLNVTAEVYSQLFKIDRVSIPGQLVDETINTLLNLGPGFFAPIVNGTQVAKDNTLRGILPIEVSLTTEGIGGLKIGQSFKIDSTLLPENYKNYGLIITGLDHVIEESKWKTNIRAQTYILS